MDRVPHRAGAARWREPSMFRACLITQAKDQSSRLRNWVLYHFEQGFDAFYYFDDASEDDSVAVMQGLSRRYGIRIEIRQTDGIGRTMPRRRMQDSSSYGGIRSINQRIIRSYNRGFALAAAENPEAPCGALDVDEFLVTNRSERVVDVVEEVLRARAVDHLYVPSFDVSDAFRIDVDWHTAEPCTCRRWSAAWRARSPWKARGKSVLRAGRFRPMPQLPNYVHTLTGNDREGAILDPRVWVHDEALLRIHHFRKPGLDPHAEMTLDTTLLDRTLPIRDRYDRAAARGDGGVDGATRKWSGP